MNLNSNKLESFNEDIGKVKLVNIKKYIKLDIIKEEHNLINNIDRELKIKSEKVAFIHSEESDCKENYIYSLDKLNLNN